MTFTIKLFYFLLGFAVQIVSIPALGVCALSAETPVENPVILIPGTSRSQLVDEKGKVKWGTYRNYFKFKSRNYLAIPIESENPLENSDNLKPGKVIETIPLIPFLARLGVYKSFLKKIQKSSGYRIGNIDNPEPGSNFFIFNYDWRRDPVENALKLSRKIDRLKEVLGDSQLRFDLVAYSSAVSIAKYYLLYGDEDVLGKAEKEPNYYGANNVSKLVLVAPLTRGSLRAFKILDKGFKPASLPFLFRYGPESAFTAPAFFQMLPPKEEKIFVDKSGKPVNIDLYDASNWKRYQWSIFDEKEQARMKKKLRKEIGDGWQTEFERLNQKYMRYLESALNRANALNDAIGEAVAIPDSVELFSIIPKWGATLDRVEISANPGHLTFGGGPTEALRRSEGDLVVTVDSMRGQYKDPMMRPREFYFREKHRKLATSREVQEKVLEILSLPDVR